ncbi:MAG: hypothetical protein JWQ09_552, partial [Segetibacter sp.]|nr:hypothetical protein [Segetibacter sp.]
MRRKIISALALSVTLFNSCKKDHQGTGQLPIVKEERIAVKLNSTYVPAAKIDSAIAIWEINGQLQQERMQVSNDTLFTDVKKFTAGNGRLTVQLYTKNELRQRRLQWEKRSDINLKHTESTTWNAPADLKDATWFPRIIMIDNPTSFTAIIALRPADPYFLLKNVPAGYKIELERGYYLIPGGAISV